MVSRSPHLRPEGRAGTAVLGEIKYLNKWYGRGQGGWPTEDRMKVVQ